MRYKYNDAESRKKSQWNTSVNCTWVQPLRTLFSFRVQTHRRAQRKDGRQKQHTGDSMSSSNWTEQRSHFSNVWARCMIFLTIFSRSVCSSNRSLTTSKSAWTRAEDDTTIDMTPPPHNHKPQYICQQVLWRTFFFFCISTTGKRKTKSLFISSCLQPLGWYVVIVSPSNCFLYHSSLLWVVVSLFSLPLLINVWHKLVHPLTFPMRLSPSPPTSPTPPNTAGENVHAGLGSVIAPLLQRQQVGCHWSILGLAVSIMGAVVMLILRTRRRWLGLLYWLVLWSLPGSCHTPSLRQQTVGRWRWRCRRKAGTSAAPGQRKRCNVYLKIC